MPICDDGHSDYVESVDLNIDLNIDETSNDDIIESVFSSEQVLKAFNGLHGFLSKHGAEFHQPLHQLKLCLYTSIENAKKQTVITDFFKKL